MRSESPAAAPPSRTAFTTQLADLGLRQRGHRAPPSEFHTAVRQGAAQLRDRIARALPGVQDASTRAHLEAIEAQLAAWQPPARAAVRPEP